MVSGTMMVKVDSFFTTGVDSVGFVLGANWNLLGGSELPSASWVEAAVEVGRTILRTFSELGRIRNRLGVSTDDGEKGCEDVRKRVRTVGVASEKD